jgi:hypothetical protein
MAVQPPSVAVSSFLGNPMRPQLVNNYLNDLDRHMKISGSFTECVISEAVKDTADAKA